MPIMWATTVAKNVNDPGNTNLHRRLTDQTPHWEPVVAFILIRWVEFARIEIQVVTPGRRAHSTGPQVAIGTVIV